MDRKYHQLSALGVERSEFLEDLVGGLGPHKRARVLVEVCEECIDGLCEFLDAAKHTAANALVSDLTKESLDEVEPR